MSSLEVPMSTSALGVNLKAMSRTDYDCGTDKRTTRSGIRSLAKCARESMRLKSVEVCEQSRRRAVNDVITLEEQRAVYADTVSSVRLSHGGTVGRGENSSILSLDGFLGRHCREVAGVECSTEIGGVRGENWGNIASYIAAYEKWWDSQQVPGVNDALIDRFTRAVYSASL